MRLESIADSTIQESFPFQISEIISFKPTIEAILNDLKNKVALPEISSKFHNTIIEVILAVAYKIRTETGLNKVVLSGGSFQNAILLEKSEYLLTKKGFEIFSHSLVPSNDGGIALGQLAIAAKRRSLGLI